MILLMNITQYMYAIQRWIKIIWVIDLAKSKAMQRHIVTGLPLVYALDMAKCALFKMRPIWMSRKILIDLS